MTLIDSIIMGIIQGLTEFLPVSSSGHLAIFGEILPSVQNEDMFFDVMLHLGTLVAVCVAFHKEIYAIIIEFFKSVRDIFTGKFSFKNMSDERRMLVMLVVATLPLFVILPVRDVIETLSNSLIAVGIALFITALFLFISDRMVKGEKDKGDITYKNAVTVGLFQALATVPGISRSGSTITAGLLCGFKKELAVKFSFIMSLPAVVGAGILEAADVLSGETALTAPAYVYIIGVAVSAIVGYLSIKLLQWVLNRDKFRYFAIYCALAGATAIVLHFI